MFFGKLNLKCPKKFDFFEEKKKIKFYLKEMEFIDNKCSFLNKFHLLLESLIISYRYYIILHRGNSKSEYEFIENKNFIFNSLNKGFYLFENIFFDIKNIFSFNNLGFYHNIKIYLNDNDLKYFPHLYFFNEHNSPEIILFITNKIPKKLSDLCFIKCCDEENANNYSHDFFDIILNWINSTDDKYVNNWNFCKNEWEKYNGKSVFYSKKVIKQTILNNKQNIFYNYRRKKYLPSNFYNALWYHIYDEKIFWNKINFKVNYLYRLKEKYHIIPRIVIDDILGIIYNDIVEFFFDYNIIWSKHNDFKFTAVIYTNELDPQIHFFDENLKEIGRLFITNEIPKTISDLRFSEDLENIPLNLIKEILYRSNSTDFKFWSWCKYKWEFASNCGNKFNFKSKNDKFE